MRSLRKIFKTHHHAEKEVKVQHRNYQIMNDSPPPPIGTHPRKLYRRLQEAPGVGSDNCGKGREDNFEAETVVLFGDGIRHLPLYYLLFRMQQLQS